MISEYRIEEDVEETSRGPIWGIIWKNWDKLRETSVRTGGSLVEVWTWDLPGYEAVLTALTRYQAEM